MPATLPDSHSANNFPSTSSWLLAASLLLSLLCLGNLARLPESPQASRMAAPASLKIMPASWRPPLL